MNKEVIEHLLSMSEHKLRLKKKKDTHLRVNRKFIILCCVFFATNG